MSSWPTSKQSQGEAASEVMACTAGSSAKLAAAGRSPHSHLPAQNLHPTWHRLSTRCQPQPTSWHRCRPCTGIQTCQAACMVMLRCQVPCSRMWALARGKLSMYHISQTRGEKVILDCPYSLTYLASSKLLPTTTKHPFFRNHCINLDSADDRNVLAGSRRACT